MAMRLDTCSLALGGVAQADFSHPCHRSLPVEVQITQASIVERSSTSCFTARAAEFGLRATFQTLCLTVHGDRIGKRSVHHARDVRAVSNVAKERRQVLCAALK
jgi:hypothetical protein